MMDRNYKYADRLNEAQPNNQGCIMKVIEYYGTDNIVVEFQDKYKAIVHTSYRHFKNGNVKNPYYPSVCNIGIVGSKYPCSVNKKITKEYEAWQNIIIRCYNKTYKNKNSTYKNATCCNGWLNFEIFYEWLHSQPNFDKWMNGKRWAVDKDILIKGNKEYNPSTCCLVPMYINSLFTKQDCKRGNLPIGVSKHGNKFRARFNNMLSGELEIVGSYDAPEEAFQAYKYRKESYIKQVAQEEYSKGNITRQCYDAMMSYEVEITD